MHEDKTCPRCHSVFECKVGDVTNCQCYPVKLNDAERDFLSHTYSDCLCAGCMQSVRTAYNQAQKEIQLKQVFGLR
jgi:hypothetical protein